MRKEFIPGKLKPEYALMNKVIHNMIRPKGKEKLPNKEEIQFLYEVMNGKIIDYAMVIWCIILRSPTKNRNIPFQTLVKNLVEAAGIRGFGREKRVLPRLGPSQTRHKRKAESLPQGLSQHIPLWLLSRLHRRQILVRWVHLR